MSNNAGWRTLSGKLRCTDEAPCQVASYQPCFRLYCLMCDGAVLSLSVEAIPLLSYLSKNLSASFKFSVSPGAPLDYLRLFPLHST